MVVDCHHVACGVCVVTEKKSKLGKRSSNFHWVRGRISAPENTKKNPWLFSSLGYVSNQIFISFQKHTVWQPGPCTVCTCEDPIVLCETIRCTDPSCDYDSGEYLQISADSCCPECVPQLSACSYQDRSIPVCLLLLIVSSCPLPLTPVVNGEGGVYWFEVFP